MTINKAEAPIVPALEKLPYPDTPFMRKFYKSPLMLWRLGLGPLVGRLFMILSTWGRKTGRSRHTPIEYHLLHDRSYVMAAWPRSDWYQNLQADPHVTVQTSAGTQAMLARRVTDDAELAEIYAYVEAHPTLRRIWETLGIEISREAFMQEKERFHLLTFEPTDEPAPEPLAVDLWWVWFLLPAAWLLKRLFGHR